MFYLVVHDSQFFGHFLQNPFLLLIDLVKKYPSRQSVQESLLEEVQVKPYNLIN